MSSGRSAPVIEKLPPETVVWFVSDLHLGDGTPSDVFFGKDPHLLALLDAARQAGATVVVAGDAIDFAQAWTFTRILKAHHELLSAMSALAREGRLYYLVGNHDYDVNLYREMLFFRVCHELHLGDQILVQHGYQYDPLIGKDIESSHVNTTVHHLLERYLDTWIRVPLKEFYTLPNRFIFWLAHKIGLITKVRAAVLGLMSVKASPSGVEKQLNYWARANMGDSMCMYEPVMARLREDRWRYIVCGHSHLPGIVRHGERAYVNTGSWTFASSQYVIWDGAGFSCQDWITGQVYGDELYQQVAAGAFDDHDFWSWWHDNYMGFLRFREGEEGRGRLRGWESYVRDYQHLAQLRPFAQGALVGAPREEHAEEE
ncbi:MAG: metallophosphoesterase [Deltaproteobacteria bacterium]|nr:metallophosphoesterase [Deltaproteobacteria bacterium]